MWRGRYCWLSTSVTPKVPTTQPASGASASTPGIAARRARRRARGGRPAPGSRSSPVRPPKRSAIGPSSIVPTAPAGEHERQHEVAVAARMAVGALPERHEGDEPEPGEAAAGDHRDQHRHRARAVGAGAPGASGGGSGTSRAQGRGGGQEQPGHDQARQRQQEAAPQAEPDDEGCGDRRARARSRRCRRPRTPTCRSPAARRSRRRRTSTPSGWKAATPTPETTTSRRRRASSGERRPPARSRGPTRPTPSGISQSAPRRSDQSPNRGWMTDEETEEARMRTAERR